MQVKTHPLMELIAKKLFGINSVPDRERSKMVVRACKAAAKWHDEEIQKLSDNYKTKPSVQQKGFYNQDKYKPNGEEK